MKEAFYYKKLREKAVNCTLCPTYCVVKPGDFGNCGARKNIDGKLYSLVYGKPASIAVDPIEKKPLYHFLPGSKSLSFGTVGCNMHCLQCQNYDISQVKADNSGREVEPREIVELAMKEGCQSISYTYNEPTIFFEYALEIAKLARKKGIKNVMVTNGYINKEPLLEIYPLIDAANIDLMALDEGFYKRVCSVRLKPVLEAIKAIKKTGTWIELTNLIIPGYNDILVENLVKWVKEHLGERVPLHFSAFHPTYKMMDVPRTPDETLIVAKKIAAKNGLKYAYLGNTSIEDGGSTFCPRCGKKVIERGWFEVERNEVKKGVCPNCDEKIEGVWNSKKFIY